MCALSSLTLQEELPGKKVETCDVDARLHVLWVSHCQVEAMIED